MRTRRSAAALACLVLALLGVAAGPAGSAAAIDDATHPDARVTHGPSCRPGGLAVEVVAGTLPYSVRLTTTRSPEPEAEALLQPGQAVVLRTGDVAPGETIDARLEYAAQDGSGTTFVDELADYTFTRPTAEDCDAATAPPPSPTPEPAPEPQPAPEPPTTPQPPLPPSSTPPSPTPVPPSPVPSTTPSPTTTPAPPTAPTTTRPPAPSAEPSAAGTSVAAGGTVRIRVEGYRPGERVTIALRGSGEVLGSATAADDGSVTAEVRIPARTAAGPAALDVVGGGPESAAAVPLQVAAAVSGTGGGRASSLPLLAAAGALTATATALVSAAALRRPGR